MYLHNLAGTAIGPLKETCGLEIKALEIRRAWKGASEGAKESGKTEEGWKQLLGVCYSEDGECGVCDVFHFVCLPRGTYMEFLSLQALEAFLECIRTFPYSTFGFIQRTAEADPGVLFGVSSGTRHFASIILAHASF